MNVAQCSIKIKEIAKAIIEFKPKSIKECLLAGLIDSLFICLAYLLAILIISPTSKFHFSYCITWCCIRFFMYFGQFWRHKNK